MTEQKCFALHQYEKIALCAANSLQLLSWCVCVCVCVKIVVDNICTTIIKKSNEN